MNIHILAQKRIWWTFLLSFSHLIANISKLNMRKANARGKFRYLCRSCSCRLLLQRKYEHIKHFFFQTKKECSFCFGSMPIVSYSLIFHSLLRMLDASAMLFLMKSQDRVVKTHHMGSLLAEWRNREVVEQKLGILEENIRETFLLAKNNKYFYQKQSNICF